MIKYILSLLTIFSLTVIQADAQQTTVSIKNPIGDVTVAGIITKVIGFMVQIGSVAVVLAIVYAGFLFVAAQGNPGEIAKAKTTLFWTIIGAMVLLGAQLIAGVVESTLKELK